MKAISQKQFDNAVATVLNGGKSKLVETREERPFTWSRSKGYMNLRGSIPANSKFLRNDARGGKENDVYLVCYLANGYKIENTKKEAQKELKLETSKKSLELKKRQEKANKMKELAFNLGFSSVTKLKQAQKEIENYNYERMQRALKLREENFIKENGSFDMIKISDRIKISRIDLVFDCKKKQDLF